MAPIASLSLDLDNLWCYLKVHGDPQWRELPTFLPEVVPLILDVLRRRGLRITFFVVGQDLLRAENREAVRLIAEVGHEIANHSFRHEPWIGAADPAVVVDEIERTERLIVETTGARPVGFRAPGYARSRTILETLRARDYSYDASLLPSTTGPLARLYYFARSSFSREELRERGDLFGSWRDRFLPLRPFEWQTGSGALMEIPVSVCPFLRTPFHLSYLMWLSQCSRAMANAYLRMCLGLCGLGGVEPSYLLHPVDFLGKEDAPALSFFPGMNLSRAEKLRFVDEVLAHYTGGFEILSLSEHCARARKAGGLAKEKM